MLNFDLSFLIDVWGTAIRDIRAGTAIIVVSLGIPRALWRVDCVNSFFFTCFDVQIGVFRGAWGTIGS